MEIHSASVRAFWIESRPCIRQTANIRGAPASSLSGRKYPSTAATAKTAITKEHPQGRYAPLTRGQ